MMLEKLKKIYNLMPIPMSTILVKSLHLNPYSRNDIWDQVYLLDRKMMEFYEDPLKVEHYINNELTAFIDYSRSMSPFWAKYLNHNILNYHGLQNIAPIDAHILLEHFNEIVNLKEPGYMTSTGGSGRNPMKVYTSNKSYYTDIVHVLWGWHKLGYNPNDRKLTLRGVNIGDNLVKYNPIYNELQVNIFKLNENNTEELIKVVNKFNPVFGHGYPSAFVKLAYLLKKIGLKMPLKGISFASENYNEEQRTYVETQFVCEACGFYGHSEKAAFATELPSSKGNYIVHPTYGIIEVLKDNGERAKEGELGEIVCTGFINKGMPLIRYRTGDYAVVNKTYNEIVLEVGTILGRWGKDFVIDSMGNKISTTAINIHSKVQYEFKYIQLWQNEIGTLIIKLVPWDLNNNVTNFVNIIKIDFQEKLRNIEIVVELCEENQLYFSHRGKVPYLVSNVTIPNNNR